MTNRERPMKSAGKDAIKAFKKLPTQVRDGIRGGSGRAEIRDYLAPGEMAGVLMASRVTLEAGAAIGEHLHSDTEELYVILQGQGRGLLDGESFPVERGDAFLLKAGHTHGLINDGGEPLTFFAVLTRGEEGEDKEG
jgi:mannose-6-phosphate isomerase-like protein (cupin superfamily)